MSENWIYLIPEDPGFIPDEARQRRARDRFAEILPQAQDVDVKVYDRIEFINCGQNFGRISCPSCGSEIPLRWWQDRMNQDYGDGFRLLPYATPCCGAKYTMHELDYESPQGFGCFKLKARDAGIGNLDDKYKEALEKILDTKLRVIYCHI
jgi:hypothetical protein